MRFSVPEELSVLGVTYKDFEKKRFILNKSSLNSEVNENDIIWELYKDLLKKANNFEILQMIYWNMAVFKDKIGQNSFEYQQKSQQSRLLNFRQQGKEMVKISADGCSSSCGKLHNLVFPISKAIKNLPIPNPKCESKLNSNNSLCKSIYLVAKENEVASMKLPPPVEDIPEISDVIRIFKENKKKSSKFALESKKNIILEHFLDWAIPFFTFVSGLVMFFYSPIASFVFIFWSVVFSPIFMRILGKGFPFFKKKIGRYIIFGTGFSIIFFSMLINFFPDETINSFQQKRVIPSYQILSIRDHSINTRSRLFVSIESPEAKSSKERALVVMEAAKQIYSDEFSNESNNLKYDYIFVSLEVKKLNSDQRYIFAEAEFSPDRKGFGGPLNSNNEKWKWNVRSSNLSINQNKHPSLQKVKATLKTFLLR